MKIVDLAQEGFFLGGVTFEFDGDAIIGIVGIIF